MRVLVLSDTHVGPNATRDLPPHVWKLVESADAVLHAGDIKTDEFLESISGAGTVEAAAANLYERCDDPATTDQAGRSYAVQQWRRWR